MRALAILQDGGRPPKLDTPSASWLLLRALAPFVWRTDDRIAEKLEGFAATEAGSALDMLKAAELVEDPRLRRLFFRHAVDEARHAELFRAAARRLVPGPPRSGSEYALIHATRQNLFARYSLVRFLAFVYVAEKRGELLFRVLAAHFAGRPELAELFTRIAKDERFHVAYSGRLLRELRQGGRGTEVRWALATVRLTRAWEAWRRTGRVLGDAATKLMLGFAYLVALPIFAVVQQVRDPERGGWHRPPPRDDHATAAARLAAARWQF
jgi:rubrerythrin